MAIPAYQHANSQARPLSAGLIGGLGGGLVFGMMMGMMGMLPMVAALVGSSSAVLGFVVHMGISTFIGATFGLAVQRLPARRGVYLAAGVLNGLVWWVLGALVLMPLALGMPEMVLTLGPTQGMSLVGHLIFGLVAALLFIRFNGQP